MNNYLGTRQGGTPFSLCSSITKHHASMLSPHITRFSLVMLSGAPYLGDLTENQVTNPYPSLHLMPPVSRQLHEFGELRRRYMHLYCQRLESLHQGGLVQQQQDASVASEHHVLQHGHHHHVQPPQPRRASADILAESHEVRSGLLIYAVYIPKHITNASCDITAVHPSPSLPAGP